ncbi:MAG TPA: Clp1/GlmU family protein [archaeon]|nr:Clp1/GlmU family protein [archaeon]
MRYHLSPKNTVIVRGPASIILLAGQATVLGGPIVANQTKIVASQKQLPIETETGAELEIAGELAEIFEIQGSTIPSSWRLAATALEQMREETSVILGPPDVGKSTLCVYLVNKLLQSGLTLRVIDADIGQADMGPPTTIGSAVPTRPIISLQELRPDRRLFIGTISPSGVEQKLISGIQRLMATGSKMLTIINTDGWVSDFAAILYKINLLTQLQPDLVLGLTYSNEIEPILGGVRFHSMKVAAAKDALERSRVDRRFIRADAYRRSLEGAITRRVSLEVPLILPAGLRQVSRSDRRVLNNLIVGILDEEGYLAQIGILMGIDDEGAWIYSRQAEAPRTVEVGRVKLSTSGSEIGFL